VFAPALTPEDAEYPERWTLSLFAVVSLLALWGIVALIAATVADHRY
jgi:capsule polysaccharide export protein KpsE/RkpR